ncbi:Murein-DD-endopeptidase [Escherichia coli ISC7]|uniref:Murein-DD-endopeptidase n=1 Tax=Escherichia coli ISC7 TaxID=1432555 RepID=W1F6Z4_ECOLX|nr:Murein-DD-endopeptidase [Escherichia coli ISC7]
MLIMPKFRVSLFSLALMLAVPLAPQAVAKTQPLPPLHNRKLPPVAR